MSVDSHAAFSERVLELGLGAHVARFETSGWRSMADLAFATSYAPGNDESIFITEVVSVGLGAPDHVDKNRLRRLFFEAYALSSADLKRRVDATPDDAPRVVPNAERLERRRRVATRLAGLATGGQFVGELNVSDRLLDTCIEMYEKNQIFYVAPEMCTKKSVDILGTRRDRLWESVPNATGQLVFKKTDDAERAALGSQFALGLAFQRRGLALEMADIISYDHSETLRSRLIAAFMEAPPTGYAAVSIEQIFDADQVAWTLLAEKTVDGIKRKGTDRPCDMNMPAVLDSFKFAMAISPRLGSAAARAPQRNEPPAAPAHAPAQPGRGEKRIRGNGGKGNKKIAPQAAKQQQQQQQPRVQPAKERQTHLPKGLVGMASRTSQQKGSLRLCYGFNLGTCSAVAPGASCLKGLHGCMKPLASGDACGEPHAASACRR